MDLKLISELIKMIEGSKLSSMEIEVKDLKLKLTNNVNNTAPIVRNEIIEEINNIEYTNAALDEKSLDITEKEGTPKVVVDDSKTRTVKSPMVGTFYASSSPDSDAYVSVGSKVKKGATLCIIEAMKLMNEIESEEEGTIVEVLVNNGDLVEYGQPLFKIM